jgi:hypothetical protein
MTGDKSRTFFFTPDADTAPELEDGEVVTDLVLTASPEATATILERLAARLRVSLDDGDSVQVHLGPGRGDWRIFTKGAEDDATVEEVAREEASALAAHPLAPIVNEVLALGQRHYPDAGTSPGDYMQTIYEITEGVERRGTFKSQRDKFLMIAALALAGAEAEAEAHEAEVRERAETEEPE